MFRKYQFGHEKRSKKKRVEQLIQSQKGALDKFFVKNLKYEKNLVIMKG